MHIATGHRVSLRVNVTRNRASRKLPVSDSPTPNHFASPCAVGANAAYPMLGNEQALK